MFAVTICKISGFAYQIINHKYLLVSYYIIPLKKNLTTKLHNSDFLLYIILSNVRVLWRSDYNKMGENNCHKDALWKMAHMQLFLSIMLNITQSWSQDFHVEPCCLQYVIFNPFPLYLHTLHIHLPMKMEQTQCSETSAIKHQMLGNNPKDYPQHYKVCKAEHLELIKQRASVKSF
jgi:hypothetical protein